MSYFDELPMSGEDLAATLHRLIYKRSDRANAASNRNPDFQAGFTHGLTATTDGSAHDVIEAEWERRGRPPAGEASFHEWKRGLWAAALQRLFADEEENQRVFDWLKRFDAD